MLETTDLWRLIDRAPLVPFAGVEYKFGVTVFQDSAELRSDDTACTVSTFEGTLPHVTVSPKVGSPFTFPDCPSGKSDTGLPSIVDHAVSACAVRGAYSQPNDITWRNLTPACTVCLSSLRVSGHSPQIQPFGKSCPTGVRLPICRGAVQLLDVVALQSRVETGKKRAAPARGGTS